MSDVDDDLLALAGAGGGSETEDELPVKRKREDSETEEEYGLGSDADEGDGDDDDDDNNDDDAAGPRASPGGDDSDEGEETAGDVEYGEKNPYPLEGKYRDEADRAKLLALPEIEREEILFDRSQEMQRFEERRYLAQRAHQRKQQLAQAQGDQRQLRRDREVVGVSGAKKNQLQALKKRRQERERRSQGAMDSDYEGSDEDEDEDEEKYGSDYSDREVEWDEGEKREEVKPLSASDLNRIRFGKTLLAKYCYYPNFEAAVTGSFVRVNIGYNHQKQQNVYRVCQVIKLVKVNKVYTFMDRVIDQVLLVSHAGSERQIEMGIASDSPITASEFEYWKNAMEQAQRSLPQRYRVDAKFNEMRELRRALTSQEIEEMVQRRQALTGSKGANTVLERSVLQEQREQALEQGNKALVVELDERLASLDEKAAVRTASAADDKLSKLASVNERNRRNNVAEIRKAEIQAQAERRKSGNVIKADPFSRLRTTARIYYNDDGEEPAPVVESSTTETEESKVTMSALDKIIAGLDIKLEIEI